MICRNLVKILRNREIKSFYNPPFPKQILATQDKSLHKINKEGIRSNYHHMFSRSKEIFGLQTSDSECEDLGGNKIWLNIYIATLSTSYLTI